MPGRPQGGISDSFHVGMVRPGEPPTLPRVPFPKEPQAPGRMQHLLQSQEIQMSQCRRRVVTGPQTGQGTDRQSHGDPQPHTPPCDSLASFQIYVHWRKIRWAGICWGLPLRGALLTSQVELGSELTGVFSCASRCLCHCPDSASAGGEEGGWRTVCPWQNLGSVLV